MVKLLIVLESAKYAEGTIVHNCLQSTYNFLFLLLLLFSSASAANKNQLYSPHSSSSFRWVGLAGTWLELGPHTSGKIYLSAAIGSPGTYDLGSRLEVLCRSPGAPEADAVSQRWHIESAFVVSSAPSSGL